MDKIWKIACAVVYLTICTLDFIILPSYILHITERTTGYAHYERINEIFKDDPESVRLIISQGRSGGDWTPFSLRSGGLLHVAFGAILTGSIIGRKKED